MTLARIHNFINHSNIAVEPSAIDEQTKLDENKEVKRTTTKTTKKCY